MNAMESIFSRAIVRERHSIFVTPEREKSRSEVTAVKGYSTRTTATSSMTAGIPLTSSSSTATSIGAGSPSTVVQRLRALTSNEDVIKFIRDQVELCQPDRVHIMTGEKEEYQKLCDQMTKSGMLIKLDQTLRPNSYLARSDQSDVARLESRTFICSEREEDAGPTNNWMDPTEMKSLLSGKFRGCMRGRTMYIIPFSMGPIDGSISQNGIQITDSPYVAASMTIMARVSSRIFDVIGHDGKFIPCVHSVGAPLGSEAYDSKWPMNKDKYIVHFPEAREIWSFGSGYGGNALLGKKCLALRIGSAMARDEGWLAEHMVILGITNPAGKKKYFSAAFPSACGKTNLAMLQPSLPGWKVEVVGDDIAWMRINKSDGKLYAINPENGFFGVAPGTNNKSNLRAMETLRRDTIFTNVALTKEGDVWWEGMTKEVPAGMTDWLGKEYDPATRDPEINPAAHKNSRFTVPITNCPAIDENFDNPDGIPISAILFGGRRKDTVPLVYQAPTWQHGVFCGASMRSEVTAAASDVKKTVRNDPFAMLPFCGYNMADYWRHWLNVEHLSPKPDALPKVFFVNWFQRDPQTNKFIWPGFSDNIRVLKWIFDRTDDADNVVHSPIGLLPKPTALDMSGLPLSESDKSQLFKVDPQLWKEELQRTEDYFHGKEFEAAGKSPKSINAFVERMPKEMWDQIDLLRNDLKQM